MTANEIRGRFLEFFEARGHRIVPSDSLIPTQDPTLLFTGSGMNQFKPLFLGKPTDFKRQASCQKCLRTDDLPKVGKTAGHHTFFEMLGNFSFGDYFKEEAIGWAWEFMTDVLKLSPERLWVSVHQEDQESFDIWRDKVGLPEARIIKLGDKENFWPSEAPMKGPNGPCGPCSEIFFDQGRALGCGRPTPLEAKALTESTCGPACDCDRFVELWNLVFTQYDRKPDGTLSPLPSKNIDTGMGLERMAAVIEGVPNNFETELFTPIIEELEKWLDIKYGKDKSETYHLKAISDHLRAITFAVADGVWPTNEGRGFVLRKLIRWAAGHAKYFRGREVVERPFLFELIPTVIRTMEEPYPELVGRGDHIQTVLKLEEERFVPVWEEGLRELKEKARELKGKEIPGEFMFRLKDTYGFPVDIDSDILSEHVGEFRWDRKRYEEEMARQRERARLGSQIGLEIFALDQVASKIRSIAKATKFLGYDKAQAMATVVGLLKNEEVVDRAEEGDEVKLVLDETPFYGEAGGQIGDRGLVDADRGKVEIRDAKRADDVIVHLGKVVAGSIRTKDKVKASIDEQRRSSVMRNHTSTHLLQSALREVLGPHIQQSGSLVSWDRLRFDFTHHKALTQDECDRIEALINEWIRANSPVKAEYMAQDEARKAGAIAIFGEKYGERVRVVSVGDYSKELCGGTHMSSTGGIGLFRILSESSIASGVRRIEAVTGSEAYRCMKEDEARLSQLAQVIRAKPEEVVEKVEELTSKLSAYEKELEGMRAKLATRGVEEIIAKAIDVEGIKVITHRQEKMEPKDLRRLCDLVREKVPGAVVVLSSVADGRVVIVCNVAKELIQRGLSAGRIADEVAKVVGGSGGGTPEMGQAGGRDPSRLNEALKKVPEIIKRQLKR